MLVPIDGNSSLQSLPIGRRNLCSFSSSPLYLIFFALFLESPVRGSSTRVYMSTQFSKTVQLFRYPLKYVCGTKREHQSCTFSQTVNNLSRNLKDVHDTRLRINQVLWISMVFVVYQTSWIWGRKLVRKFMLLNDEFQVGAILAKRNTRKITAPLPASRSCCGCRLVAAAFRISGRSCRNPPMIANKIVKRSLNSGNLVRKKTDT